MWRCISAGRGTTSVSCRLSYQRDTRQRNTAGGKHYQSMNGFVRFLAIWIAKQFIKIYIYFFLNVSEYFFLFFYLAWNAHKVCNIVWNCVQVLPGCRLCLVIMIWRCHCGLSASLVLHMFVDPRASRPAITKNVTQNMFCKLNLFIWTCLQNDNIPSFKRESKTS